MGSHYWALVILILQLFKAGNACTTEEQSIHRKSGPCSMATLQTRAIYQQMPWQWSRRG